jgi:hypothetical protein
VKIAVCSNLHGNNAAVRKNATVSRVELDGLS